METLNKINHGRIQLAIKRGTYSAGDPLPTAKNLCKTFGTSPVTIQKCLDMLKTDWLFESCPGKGVYVVKGPTSPDRKNRKFVFI